MKKVTLCHVVVALSLAVAFHMSVLTFLPLSEDPGESPTVDALRIQLAEDLVPVPEDNDEPGSAPDAAEAREILQDASQITEEPLAEKEPTEVPKEIGQLREPGPQGGSIRPPKGVAEQSADKVDPGENEVPELIPVPTFSEADRAETKLPLATSETSPAEVHPGEPSDDTVEGDGGTNLQKPGGGESLAAAGVVPSEKTPDFQPDERIQGGVEEVSEQTNTIPAVQSSSRLPPSESAYADSAKTGVNDGSREMARASPQGADQPVSHGGTVAEQDRPELYEADQQDVASEGTSGSGGVNPILEHLVLDTESEKPAAGKPAGLGIAAYEFVWSDTVTSERDIPENNSDRSEAPMPTPKSDPLEKEGGWDRECEDENNPETCQIVQDVHLQRNVNGERRDLGRILRVSISRESDSNRTNGGLYITIYLPLGVDLRPGAVIKVDQGAEIQLRYLKCTAAGCRVDVPIDEPLLNAMGAEGRLFVGFLPWGGAKTNIIPASLKGFSRALASLP